MSAARDITDLRVVPVDDLSHSICAYVRAELPHGIAVTRGRSDGGPFELHIANDDGDQVTLNIADVDAADALIVLLMGAREIAFGAPFDPDAVTCRS